MAEVVAENLATNPSFEVASGEVVVRENLFPDPDFTGTDWVALFQRSTVTPTGDGKITVERTSESGASGPLSKAITAVSGGQSVTFSARRELLDGAISTGGTQPGQLRLRFQDAEGADLDLEHFSSLSLTDPDTYAVISVTAPATATQCTVRFHGGGATGDKVTWSEPLIERGPERLPFFGPTTPASGDFTYRARSGGGAQEVAQKVAGTGSGSAALAFQSHEWVDTGLSSMRVRPTGTSEYSYGEIYSPRVGAGLVAGNTYTVKGKMRIAAPYVYDTGSRRGTVAFYNRTSGAVTTSTPVPNIAGVHDFSFTFTVPASCTSGTLLFYSGSSDPRDELWVDSVAVIEGTYDGPYFDGGTQNTATYKYAWTGTPNASTSTKSLVTASDFNLPPGENIRSTLSRYIWFGNQRVQQWLPMPSSGTQASYEYAVGGGGLANGGFHAHRSSGFHKTYQFDFAVREADQWNGIEGYNRFASGIDSGIISSGGGTGSGIGEGVLFRFCDPMVMGRNMFTPQWAAPQLCNEFEGEGFHDIAPTRGDTYVTPQNTRHYPATAPYWDLTASDSASASRQPKDGPRHTFKLLVPPTHVLYLGFVGLVTGAGAVFVEKRFRDGTSGVETITELIDPTSGDGLGSMMVDGSEVAYVTMWLGSTSPGSAAQVALVASTAIELPYWETPDMSTGGWWTEGLGHSGLEFGDGAFVETYEVAVQGGRGRYLKGMSTSLVEVGAWR